MLYNCFEANNREVKNMKRYLVPSTNFEGFFTKNKPYEIIGENEHFYFVLSNKLIEIEIPKNTQIFKLV